MKRILILAAGLLMAADLTAATVVLKDGKRLNAAGYFVSGSYVVVQYANGRRESYPLSLVDLQGTKTANGEKAPAPAAAKDATPHSPFIGAKANSGTGGVVVTDADVRHNETPTPGDETKKPDAKDAAAEKSDEGQLVLVSYEKTKVGEKEWEIAATVANQTKSAVSNVGATIRVLDSAGKLLTTGSGSLTGNLEPGGQGKITTHIAFDGDPAQVGFDLSWQSIQVTSPSSPVAGKAQPAAKPKASTPQAALAPPPAWSIPKGASPNTIPANVMAPVPPNTAGGTQKASPAPTTS